MNVTVFISVLSAMGAFAGGATAVWGVLAKTKWWKRRQEEQRARHARQDAMAELVDAQLNTNGGGSFLDKMNATKETVDRMAERMQANSTKIDSLAESMASNHAQGQESLEKLREQDSAMETRLGAIEQKTDVLRKAADGLQMMADGLKVSLPEALGVQEQVVRDVHSLTKRMDRVEAELFGD